MTLLELFSDPKRWTQGALALKGDGLRCGSTDPEATCFCLLGGIIRVYDTMPGLPRMAQLIDKMRATPTWQECNYASVPDFNDNVSYETLIQMLKECNL